MKGEMARCDMTSALDAHESASHYVVRVTGALCSMQVL